MNDRERKLVTASLLHDIGKVIYRSGDGRNHSTSGYDFIKDETDISDSEVLDCIRFHHGKAIKGANLPQDALPYIVYIADNIAAAADRRETNGEEEGFDKRMPLSSIYNIINGNNQDMHYHPQKLSEEGIINIPSNKQEYYDESFYAEMIYELKEALKGIEKWQDSHINSLLSVLEAYLTYVPSSTARHELSDISLYDHLKMTAAFAACIKQCLDDKEENNYCELLYKNAMSFYSEKAFSLFSMDISGIQNFIYTVSGEGAVRMLRSRSFYLEVLMEHMIDEILEACSLSRCNLIYSGGGHCYILLPNTEKTKWIVRGKMVDFNNFFMKKYGNDLYVSFSIVPCSAEELCNKPEGSYSSLFHRLSSEISAQKSHRYCAKQIHYFNNKETNNSTRECRICRRSDFLTQEDKCEICSAIEDFSGEILYKEFFTVVRREEKQGLPLPSGCTMLAQDENTVRETMENDRDYVRTYGKNRLYTGKYVSTKLWVGDYTVKGKTTSEYAAAAKGIDRIAVLRADVDNLGTALVSGFPGKYNTLSRTATFSRQLSLFFKHYINRILQQGKFSLDGEAQFRNVVIIYSGGDDILLIGSWNDVIEGALDIKECFREYTQGTLTLSAGIGMYGAGFPVSRAAVETAELEDAAKQYPDSVKPMKNAVALFDKEYCFSWKDFKNRVVGEKLNELMEYLDNSKERGKTFVYRFLDLIRNTDDRLNLARFAYLIARLEPDNCNNYEKESYSKFTKQMYGWITNESDKKQLIAAIYIYIYLRREGEGQ